jgi:hypothetical protein
MTQPPDEGHAENGETNKNLGYVVADELAHQIGSRLVSSQASTSDRFHRTNFPTR